MRVLVLGLGNEYAGDDALGVLAVRALRGELDGLADVVESAAHGLALIEVLTGYDAVVVVDSILTRRYPPGTVVELGLGELGPVVAPSLHQGGIPELAAVAERLGLGFPANARVFAVEIAGPPTFGEPLSAPVARAIGPLCRRVLEQVERWASDGYPSSTGCTKGSAPLGVGHTLGGPRGAGCTNTTPHERSSTI